MSSWGFYVPACELIPSGGTSKEHSDDASVHHVALSTETFDLVMETFIRLLLAVFENPQVARTIVSHLEVADKELFEVHPAMDLIRWEVLEPRLGGIAQEQRQVADDEEVVRRSTGLAGETVIVKPEPGIGFAHVLR